MKQTSQAHHSRIDSVIAPCSVAGLMTSTETAVDGCNLQLTECLLQDISTNAHVEHATGTQALSNFFSLKGRPGPCHLFMLRNWIYISTAALTSPVRTAAAWHGDQCRTLLWPHVFPLLQSCHGVRSVAVLGSGWLEDPHENLTSEGRLS